MHLIEYPTPLLLKFCFMLIDNSIYILIILNILILLFELNIKKKILQKSFISSNHNKRSEVLVADLLKSVSDLLGCTSWDSIQFGDDESGDKVRKLSEARGDLHRSRDKLQFIVTGKREW